MKGFLGQLLLIFIVLKLCGVITWSWWLVLLPLWLGILMFVFSIVLIFTWYKKL